MTSFFLLYVLLNTSRMVGVFGYWQYLTYRNGDITCTRATMIWHQNRVVDTGKWLVDVCIWNQKHRGTVEFRMCSQLDRWWNQPIVGKPKDSRLLGDVWTIHGVSISWPAQKTTMFSGCLKHVWIHKTSTVDFRHTVCLEDPSDTIGQSPTTT